MKKPSLVILDRDGVLNKMVVHPEHGTLDSPLNLSEVEVYEDAVQGLAKLTKAGIGLSIATNQPAWAKGKTTRQNLDQVHAEIIRRVQVDGARILSSHICFHRQEDQCECRKPKTGLLEAALREHNVASLSDCWMVGDGITDIEAGAKLGVKTAFVGSNKADMHRIFDERNLRPDFWGKSLGDFVKYLLEAFASQG